MKVVLIGDSFEQNVQKNKTSSNFTKKQIDKLTY